MTSRQPIPFFPTPPAEYSQQYFSQLVRAFAVYAEQARNPGPLQASSLILPTLPTSATGLAPGTVWNDGGTLRVA